MPKATLPTLDDVSVSRQPKSIFRNRNFILLWCAYTASALGDHLSEMAILHMQDATNRGDSTRISAIMLFSFMLPYFVLGPVMGWLADRLPRKWIMVSADLIRAVFMFTLVGLFSLLFNAYAGTDWAAQLATTDEFPKLNPWIYAMPLLITGIFAAMFSPSRAAMLPNLIRQDQIVRGNGLMNAMGPIASIASFLIGAKIIEAYHHDGPRISFIADGATFLLSAVLVLFIVPPPAKVLARTQTKQKQSLIDGFRYCRTHRRVVELIAFTVIFWSAASAVRSVIPAIVGHLGDIGYFQKGDVEKIGYFNAALGIGMLFGAMIVAYLGDALKSELTISWSLIGAGICVGWLATVWWLEMSQFGNYVGLFVTGMFGSGVLVSANALLQKTVPDFFRGRVFGVKDVLSMGGLLLATGFLGIPEWENIDRYVPWILTIVGLALFSSGAVATVARLKRGRFGTILTFWKNLNDFYCWFWSRTRREGVCTIPIDGPVIVAANHNSTLDPFVLGATSPNRVPGYMIAVEYARIPIFRRLVEAVECVPVNRSGVDTASVKAALRHLAAGKLLGIFPQGRVQNPAETPKVREGVGMLALRSGATVIPAYISGIKYSDSVVGPLLKRHHAVVRYGPPVDLSRWKDREKDRDIYREVAEHIMGRIMALKPKDGHVVP
ncbi:MAG: MFS transporter [Phycisphaerales bacterium]|nr:MFS transporter [Phycisphaerales bacterium]